MNVMRLQRVYVCHGGCRAVTSIKEVIAAGANTLILLSCYCV